MTLPLSVRKGGGAGCKPTVVVEVEQDRQQNRKWDGKEDIPHVKIPERHQPVSVQGREERPAGGQRCEIYIFHVADMNETREEDNGQRSAIVLEEFPNNPLEETAVSKLAADPPAHQDEKCNHDAQVGRCFSYFAPLPGQDLDALLEIDKSNVEPENVAGKASDIG